MVLADKQYVWNNYFILRKVQIEKIYYLSKCGSTSHVMVFFIFNRVGSYFNILM